MAEQTDGQVEQGYDDGGGEQTTDAGGGSDNVVLNHLQELSGKVDQLMPPPQQFPSFGEIADPSYDLYGGQEEQGYEEPPAQYDQGYQQPPQPAYQDPYAQPQQPAMSPEQVQEWLDQRIDQRAEQRAQQIIKPYINEQRAKALEAQYPDLGKPETIAQIAPEASRLAASMGLDPDTGWRHPEFLAMVYQAQQARQSASQQIAPEDQFDGNGYEGGGAGAPGADDEPNVAERILAAYPHGDAHTFWGA